MGRGGEVVCMRWTTAAVSLKRSVVVEEEKEDVVVSVMDDLERVSSI